MWWWKRMEKFSLADHVKQEEVLKRVGEDSNVQKEQ
jgi:hypothetical protein